VRQFQLNNQLLASFFVLTLMLEVNNSWFFLLSLMELLLININLTLSVRRNILWLDNLFFSLVIHFVLFMATHIDIPLSIHHVAVDQQQLQQLFTPIVFT
jgi:hypothetical protein